MSSYCVIECSVVTDGSWTHGMVFGKRVTALPNAEGAYFHDTGTTSDKSGTVACIG